MDQEQARLDDTPKESAQPPALPPEPSVVESSKRTIADEPWWEEMTGVTAITIVPVGLPDDESDESDESESAESDESESAHSPE